MDRFSPNQVPTYLVEHLATFSTTSPQHEHITPRMALQRLFKMEKTSGIWTQRMAIQLKANHMWILDGETNDVVERFPVALIQQPTSFNDQNHIYNNILIFTVQLPNEPQGELHIFQCVSHEAVNVVDDIYQWMRHYGCGSGSSGSPSGANGVGAGDKSTGPVASSSSSSSAAAAVPSSNVNVKEAVTVFNQIAAQREKKGASTDNLHHLANSADVRGGGHHHQDVDSDASSFAESTGGGNPNHRANHDMGEGYSNERYVSILNHCFDDIERFIIRLQHAAAAMRELQIRSHKRGAKGSGDGLLAIRARGPSEEEFFEILSKFKLAFNLLAKLKGCIHDPNAPELVHFLFTPLAIIIEAARSNEPPVDPSLVGVPYLNSEAIELLANCCTSKEYDLWQSLGINWIQPVKPFRLSSPYQPVFIDGWAPSITEPELIGFIGSSASESDGQDSQDEQQLMQRPHSKHSRDHHQHSHHQHRAPPPQYVPGDDSDEYEEQGPGGGGGHNLGPTSAHVVRGSPSTSHGNNHHQGHHGHRLGATSSPLPLESLERDQSPHPHHHLQDAGGNGGGGIDPEQLDWLAELQARGAKVVRVLFPRTANNNKELTVVRGEILEILDDSRKWWKARNSRGQVAHVPHTIVGEMDGGGGGVGGGVAGAGGVMVGATAAIPAAGSDGSDGWSVRERQAELTAELHQHQLQQQLQQQQNGLHLQQITVADSGSRSGSQSAEEAVVVQPAVVHPAPAPAPVPSQMIMVTAAAAAAEAHHLQHQHQNQHQQHNPPVSREQGATTSSSSASNEHQHHLKNSFERELTATVKLTVVERQVSSNTQRSKTKDNFMARFSELSEDSFSSADLLHLLRHKDFPPNLIAAIESICQADSAFPKKVLNACKDSKKSLRNLIPVEVADEMYIQRLYSNLLIVKNTMKSPGIDSELKNALSRRQEAIATNG